MFCAKCGSEIKGKEKFCPNCGAALTKSKGKATATDATQAGVAEKKAENKDAKKKKKLSWKVKFILLGIAVVLVAILALLYEPTVRLNKYLSVEFYGYDGAGRASYSFDYAKFSEDYDDRLRVKKSAIKKYVKDIWGDELSKEELNERVDWYVERPTELLRQSFSGSLDKGSDLSNGDVVTYTWSVEEETVERFFRCKIDYKDKEYKVKKLEDIDTFDPFENVTVEFYGKAPDGKVTVNRENASEMENNLGFYFDKSEGLQNGDTVTATVNMYYSSDTFAEEYGMLPYPREKTFTVEGLSSYILDADDISKELLEQMQEQAEDNIQSYAANYWSDEVSIKKISYIGNYFLTSKQNYYSSSGNTYVYLVYKVSADLKLNTEEKGEITEATDFYYYTRFSDPMLEADGTCTVDIANYYTSSDGFTLNTGYNEKGGWGTYDFYFRGYESLEKLEEAVVTRNLEYYNHQDNIEE